MLAEKRLLGFDGSQLQPALPSSPDAMDPLLGRICDMVEKLLVQAKNALVHQPSRIIGARVLTPDDVEYERKFDRVLPSMRASMANMANRSPARSPKTSTFPRSFMDADDTPRRIAARNAYSNYQLYKE